MKRYVKSNLSPIMAGTRYDQKAAEILTKSGLFDSETSNRIIQTLFTEDISAFNHAPNWLEKYLKGIARIIVEEAKGDPEKASEFIKSSVKVFNTYIAYIRKLRNKLGGAEYDKQFVEKMSFEDVKQAIKNLENDYYDDLDITLNASGYTLIPIKDYNEMHSMFGGHWTGDGTDSDGQYAGHGGTSWCHTNHESTYNSWVHGGNKFFVLAANNWKDIPFDKESNAKNAKDEYGNSLIAILVDKNGNLDRATPRSNHKGHLEGHADHQYNYQQLSAIAGFDIELAIKEYLGSITTINKTDSIEYIYQNEKYAMLKNDIIEIDGHTLYRIQALKSFHTSFIVDNISEYDFGGYIESPDNLSENGSSWVYGNAKVFGNAKVHSNSYVTGDAMIFDNAIVEQSFVCGNAKVFGNAKIYNSGVRDNAKIFDNGRLYYAAIYENAEVSENAHISERANVYGHAKVYGDAKVEYRAEICGQAKIYGKAKVYSDVEIFGDAEIYDNVEVSGYAKVYGNAKIYDMARVDGKSSICGHSQIFGNATVTNAYIHGNAIICDNAYVSGNSVEIDGDAEICERAYIGGWKCGKIHIGGTAIVNYKVSEGEILE